MSHESHKRHKNGLVKESLQMVKDTDRNPNRRDYLTMTSLTAASLATAGFSRSVHAQDGKPQEESNQAEGLLAKKLELLFLGSGAANWPRQYPPENKHLPRGQIRAMASMLVNDKILIDCGPTVLDVMNCYDVNPAEITDILLTHTHSDHLHRDNILAIAKARETGFESLRFWGDPEALKQVPDSNHIEKKLVEVGNSFRIHGLEVTGLAANHNVQGSKEQCLLYLLESSEKSVLYATDTSWLPTSTWLHIQHKKLDAIIWDATVGEGKGDYRVFSHNDLAMVRHMNASLEKGKILKPDAKIILTHIANKLHPPHDELERRLLPEGLIPAYEGMLVVLSEP
jgi:ribonuclease BN (tRNA processing enzyme)